LPHQIGHLDGGHGGIEALVAALGAGAVDGLLYATNWPMSFTALRAFSTSVAFSQDCE
jgi:hypothetical protein